MPIPKPKKGEKKADFINRCMSSTVMKKEYPDQKQRSAVCYSQVKVRKSNMNEIKQSIKLKLQLVESEVRSVQYNGASHIIAPAIILKEGVHHGQGEGGALYYPGNVVTANAFAWNGTPVAINHPENTEGELCSLNEPDIFEKECVGQLFNARAVDDNKLKVDLYLNLNKTTQHAPGLPQDIYQMKEVEVSTGLVARVVKETGQWNEEDYDGVVQEIIPDHLAVLIGQTGACSFADGCGIRANSQEGGIVEGIKEIFKRLIGISNKDESLFDKVEAIRDALRDEVKNTDISQYIEDVFDDYVIYERYGGGEDAQLFKRSYMIEADGTVTLGDKPVPVVLEKNYVEIKNKQEANAPMTKNKNDKCCPERVAALIGNEKTPYTDEDKDWLEAMTEEQLEKIELTAYEEPEVKDPPQGAEGGDGGGGTEGGESVANAEGKTMALSDLPVEMRQTVLWAQNREKAEKQNLIEIITANKKCKFTKEQLQGKDIGELELLAALSAPDEEEVSPGNKVVRLNQGRVIINTENEIEPMATPSIEGMKEEK